MDNRSATTTAAFDRGARRYDLMVRLNPGYHRALGEAASALVERLSGRPGPWHVVDLACGSGASTRAVLDAAPVGTEVLGLDASAGMLAQARRKEWPDRVRFEQAVAGHLDLDVLGPGTRDGVFTAYLFRNVPEDERDRAVCEVFELVAPGGWLVVQEYSVAGNPAALRVWNAVARGVIVPLGLVVDRNPDLYRYLWRSVLEFDSTRRFADRLVAAGFTDIARRTTSGWQHGILHTFVARKPEDR